MKNILLTGATGNFGKASINFLLQKGVKPNQIFALARTVEKAEDLKKIGINVRIGNFEDPVSLVEAFAGIDKLLFISSSDIPKRLKQHENIVSSAIKVGIKHVVYTSFVRKNETATSPIAMIATQHIETEKLIKNSGMTYTMMLNGLYADVLPAFLGEKVLETGVFLPAGNGKASFTSRINMAEAAANILTSEGHDNKEYVITANENCSLQDVSDLLTDISGREVKYLNPPKDLYIETTTKAGMPVEFAEMFASFSEAIKQGEFETTNSDLENILGRKPTSLKQYLTLNYSK